MTAHRAELDEPTMDACAKAADLMRQIAPGKLMAQTLTSLAQAVRGAEGR